MQPPWFPRCVRAPGFRFCLKNDRAISAQFPRCVWSGVPPLCLVWLSNLAFEALAFTLALNSALASALTLVLALTLALASALAVISVSALTLALDVALTSTLALASNLASALGLTFAFGFRSCSFNLEL